MSGQELHIPGLFYLCAAAAILSFVYQLRRAFVARIGQPEPRTLSLAGVLRNALVYGLAQKKVSSRQFGYASIMHLLLGWGFMELFFATTVRFLVERNLLVALLPEKDTPWFAALNEVGGLMLLGGVLMALFRRHSGMRPPTLPHNAFAGRGNFLGDTGILLVLLILSVGGFLAEAARLALETPATANASFVAWPISLAFSYPTWVVWQPWLWWSHALLALAFIALLPQTKMFHALIAVANVALTDRSQQGQLRPMNITALMEDPDAAPDDLVLGAARAEDFTWKQLLDAQACTECGRCTSVCPAHAVGSPLSPMKIILDIRNDLYARTLGDGEVRPLVDGVITATELWACTTCRACMEVCPVLIDHIPAIVDLRRNLVLSAGRPPEEAAPVLEKIAKQGNPWGYPREHRLKWAEDAGLELPLMAEKGQTDVLYWVGCAGAYDPRNQQVSRAMVAIMQAAGVDFAVLGPEENCTGDSARRLGDEYVYETVAHQNLKTMGQYQFNKIVTACPHCFHTLGTDYRQLGAEWEVVHHSQFINQLMETGKLTVSGNVTETVTYHDACYLGRHNGIYDAPREVITRALGPDANLVEADPCREQGVCCGAGGGNMWYELPTEERINLMRFDQLAATKASTVATACSFCLIMLDDACKVRDRENSIQVKDIAEIVAEGIG